MGVLVFGSSESSYFIYPGASQPGFEIKKAEKAGDRIPLQLQK
jgi:hypothetical protein